MLEHTDGDPADDVNGKNEQAGNGIAFNELGRTVHGTIEIRLLGNLGPAMLGFVLIDQAGVEIRINGHLFAGHGIQGETGTYFGDPAGTLGDHQEVDDHKNRKDHQTHGVVATDEYRTKGFDHLTGSVAALVAVQQNDPGGRHVQGQAQQRGHQQYRGERGKLHGPQGVDTDQQNDNRQGDVEREEHVQQKRRHGQNHHTEQAHQHDGNAQISPRQGFDVIED